jgi:MFS family permease
VAATVDAKPAVAPTGDETLADERRRRTQAAAAAIAGGIFTFAGGGLTALFSRDKPTVPVLGALQERLSAHPPQPGLLARQVLWYNDNAARLIVASIVLAIAAGAIGLAMSHLYRSVKARRPELPRAIVIALIAGSVLLAIAGLTQAIGLSSEASTFAGATHQTADAASNALSAPVINASRWLQALGVFGLGIAFVLLALNAMRVGLLTRFMGVLGIIVGVLFIIPIGSPLPLVQTFWLIALGALFLGRWPSGLPPAWVTGQAQPWPTQQELRERRLERQGERATDDDGDERPRRTMRRARPEPPETPAPELPERRPHSSSKKRKRKRR